MSICKDLFVDPNGTAIAAHTPNEGGPWTSEVVGWAIQSNKLQPDQEASCTVPCNFPTARARLTLDRNGANTGAIAAVFTPDIVADDSSVEWFLDLSNTGIQLLQYAVGGDNVVNLYDDTPLPAGVLTMDLIAGLGYVSLSINGKLWARVLRELAPDLPFPKFGFYANALTGAKPIISDLLVTRF